MSDQTAFIKQVHDYLDRVQQELQETDWWKSVDDKSNRFRRQDSHRRDHVTAVLRDLRRDPVGLKDGMDSIRRIVANLRVFGETVPVTIGQSVGYKRPGPGKIIWINVEGEHNPVVASRAAREKLGASLSDIMRSGYGEYGITPMIKRVPKKPDYAAEGLEELTDSQEPQTTLVV